MGTNWIVKTTCLAFCLISGSAFAQYGSPQPNYHQQQAAAQYQRQLEMLQAQQGHQIRQTAGFQQYPQEYSEQNVYGYQRYQGNTGRAASIPANPHAEAQAEYARQRLMEEQMYARERLAAQHQYQPVFPRQLPIGRNVSFRRRQDDLFGEDQAREVNQGQQEDPFGEMQQVPPPLPPQSEQPPLPPQGTGSQEPDIDAFADPPAQDVFRPTPPETNPQNQTPQQQGPQELVTPPAQQQPEQIDPFNERQGPAEQQPIMPGRDEVTAPQQQIPDATEYPPGAIIPEMFDPQAENPPRQSIVVPDLNQTENGLDAAPAVPMYPQDYPPSYEPGYPPPAMRPGDPQNQYPSGQYPPQFGASPYGGPSYGSPSYAEPPCPSYGQPTQYGAPHPPYFTNQYSPADASVYDGVVSNEGMVVSPQQCELGIPQYGCPNFYLSVFGGGVFLSDLHDYYDSARLDNGGAVGVALGQRHGCNLRSELEFTFRSNGIGGSQTITPYNQVFYQDLDGEINAYSGMTNFYWEFMNFPRRCFKPYVGAGIGFVGFGTQIYDEFNRSLIPEQDDTTSFAYQFMGGVNYKTGGNVDLFIEYRYFAAESFRINSDFGWPGGNHEYQSSNLFAGVRWKF